MENLTPLETLKSRRNEICRQLSKVELPKSIGTESCMKVGQILDITGVTVMNYLKGNVRDGYLAEAILKEFKAMKMVKK